VLSARSPTLALGPLLLALALVLAPQDASALALSGLSTSFSLAAALLALLSLDGGKHGAGAGTVTAGALALLVLAPLAHAAWRQRLGTTLRRWRRGGPSVAPRCSGHADPVLLAMARERFLLLQAAWDRAEVEVLRELTTPGMLDELLAQLPERGPGPNRTEVLALEVHLLAHERLGPLELASVEFSGLVRESAERGPMPFRELWMLARSGPDDAAGWRLARQQALL